MSAEQEFLLKILADYICERQSQKQDNLNWETILSDANKHQVEGIVYLQCKSFLPAQVAFQFLKANALSLHYYENRRYILSKLAERFDKENIEYFILKGTAVAEFYPVPAQRTMGDTDIVIHTDDRNKVYDIMRELDFDVKSQFEDREWIFSKDNMIFEIHDRLVYSEIVTEKEHKEYFNNCWKYVKNNELEWNFHFLFLILHLRKHFLNSGVGFRQFMDLAVLAKNNKELDWKWICSELEELGLIEFSKVCFAFCEKWFDVKFPIDTPELEEDFYNKATKKIFLDGIFGFENEQNKKNDAVNVAIKGKTPFFAMLHLAMLRAFPKYDSLIITGHYDFLKGRAFLLPIAWIYRFFRAIKYKKIDTGASLIEQSFVSSEDMKQRKEMLKKWKV